MAIAWMHRGKPFQEIYAAALFGKGTGIDGPPGKVENCWALFLLRS